MAEDVSPKKGPRNCQQDGGADSGLAEFLAYVMEKKLSVCPRLGLAFT